MQETHAVTVDNPWGDRPQVFENTGIREVAREKAIGVVNNAGINVSLDLMKAAPDQVITKLVSASAGQVIGILSFEVDVMISEVVQEGADMHHGPKYYERVALMRQNPLPILWLNDPKTFIRKELESVD